MQIVSTTLRAIIERVTELNWEEERLFVFEQLGKDGKPCAERIQNWECDDITNQFSREEREEIFKAVNNHWKNS